jgi:hypothetical protein
MALCYDPAATYSESVVITPSRKNPLITSTNITDSTPIEEMAFFTPSTLFSNAHKEPINIGVNPPELLWDCLSACSTSRTTSTGHHHLKDTGMKRRLTGGDIEVGCCSERTWTGGVPWKRRLSGGVPMKRRPTV